VVGNGGCHLLHLYPSFQSKLHCIWFLGFEFHTSLCKKGLQLLIINYSNTWNIQIGYFLQIATIMYMFCIFWTLMILVIRRGLPLTRSNAHAMLIQIVLGL
jgi:hypothetical protein